MAAILIVDHDPMVRLIATEMLRHSEHAILEVSDGEDALRVVASVPVDLVVLTC